MTEAQHLAANQIPPFKGQIKIIATSTSSAATDLAALFGTTLTAQFVSFISDQALTYFLGNAADDAVSAAATDDATVGISLAANTVARFKIPASRAAYKYLVHIAAGSGKIRAWVSSAS